MGRAQINDVGFEDGGRGHQPMQSPDAGKGKEMDSPLEPSKETSPAHASIFVHGDPFWTLTSATVR